MSVHSLLVTPQTGSEGGLCFSLMECQHSPPGPLILPTLFAPCSRSEPGSQTVTSMLDAAISTLPLLPQVIAKEAVAGTHTVGFVPEGEAI